MKALFIGQDYLFVLDNEELKRLREEKLEEKIEIAHPGGDLVRKIIFKFGDVKGLKEKILKLLDNPKIAKKMSQNNLKKAKQYTWDLINERYVNEYKKLIK